MAVLETSLSSAGIALAEDSAARPGRVISTLPRKRAPSSIRMRGESTLPCTWLAEPMRTLSRACKFPCTLPSITISGAAMSAFTRPFAPTVTRPLARWIFPWASPSMIKWQSPEMSPRIFNPALMVETEAIAEATSAAVAGPDVDAGAIGAAGTKVATVSARGAVGELKFGVLAAGSAAFAPGQEGFSSSVLFHIWVPPQYCFDSHGGWRGPDLMHEL